MEDPNSAGAWPESAVEMLRQQEHPPLTPERVEQILDESMRHKGELRRYFAGQFEPSPRMRDLVLR